ncbi:MAG: hypothetical protein IKR12_01225 [Clostridia bacterium]|nr:hypothetical protein [Clostridia bacterium]
MKFNICTTCGKIIEDKKMTCNTCKSNYCESCQKILKSTCLLCGKN